MSVENKRGLLAMLSPEILREWGSRLFLALVLALPGIAGCGPNNEPAPAPNCGPNVSTDNCQVPIWPRVTPEPTPTPKLPPTPTPETTPVGVEALEGSPEPDKIPAWWGRSSQ